MITLIIHSWLLAIVVWQCSDLEEATYERWGLKIRMSRLVYWPILNLITIPVVIGYTFGLLKEES